MQSPKLLNLSLLSLVSLLSFSALAAAEGHGPLPHFEWRSDTISTGGRPEGDAAFEELKKQGIETVVSVDGSAPDVEAAKRHGLKYLHIPITYDKMSDTALSSMKRLSTEDHGKLYIHCHHGVHRAPAFAAAMLRMQGNETPEQARDLLTKAGTSPDYTGLWYSAIDQPLANIQPCTAPLPERAEISSMTEAMVHVDDAFDLLKAWTEGGHKPLELHPDFVAENEVRTSIEALEVLRKLPENNDPKFAELLEASLAAGAQYETTLKAGNTAEYTPAFKAYQKSCAACHTIYRNPKVNGK